MKKLLVLFLFGFIFFSCEKNNEVLNRTGWQSENGALFIIGDDGEHAFFTKDGIDFFGTISEYQFTFKTNQGDTHVDNFKIKQNKLIIGNTVYNKLEEGIGTDIEVGQGKEKQLDVADTSWITDDRDFFGVTKNGNYGILILKDDTECKGVISGNLFTYVFIDGKLHTYQLSLYSNQLKFGRYSFRKL